VGDFCSDFGLKRRGERGLGTKESEWRLSFRTLMSENTKETASGLFGLMCTGGESGQEKKRPCRGNRESECLRFPTTRRKDGGQNHVTPPKRQVFRGSSLILASREAEKKKLRPKDGRGQNYGIEKPGREKITLGAWKNERTFDSERTGSESIGVAKA